MQKSIKFFMMILPAFFALVKPVSTIANPACIQNTKAAPIKNQNSTVMMFFLLLIFQTNVCFYFTLKRRSAYDG